jgi:hypothetical protein
MKFTQNDILRTYEKIRELSRKQISIGNERKALRTIETAAKIAYQFNWRYADEELESQLQMISERMIQPERFVPRPGRFVFYDSWGWDNCGLTQQYIRALKAQNIELLFIFENEAPEKSCEIRTELETYGKCQTFSINQSLPLAEKLDALYRRILIFQPEKMLMHITPWAVEALTVFYALPTVCKYQINLTDHAFWLGTGCLNYCFEFRSYGCTVSLEKRGLTRKQLLLNPYYPITSGEVFLGFPKEAEHRVIFFSGGSFYKIYGRDGAYFRLVKRLLEDNPECVLVFAGDGDGQKIRNFIAENHLENRFLLLGHRPDINEVFARCDIYLGTYPICGGLMSQLAADNSKPILAYTTPDIPSNYIEDIVCHNQSISITLTEEEAFFEEARKLVQSKKYRRQRGKDLKKAIISSEDFNLNFKTLLKTHKNTFKFEHVDIDYNCFTSLYIDVENNYIDTFKRLLLKTFHLKMPFLFPMVFLKTVLAFLLRGYPIKTNR